MAECVLEEVEAAAVFFAELGAVEAEAEAEVLCFLCLGESEGEESDAAPDVGEGERDRRRDGALCLRCESAVALESVVDGSGVRGMEAAASSLKNSALRLNLRREAGAETADSIAAEVEVEPESDDTASAFGAVGGATFAICTSPTAAAESVSADAADVASVL